MLLAISNMKKKAEQHQFLSAIELGWRLRRRHGLDPACPWVNVKTFDRICKREQVNIHVQILHLHLQAGRVRNGRVRLVSLFLAIVRLNLLFTSFESKTDASRRNQRP